MELNRKQIIKALEHCFNDKPCCECEWHEAGNGCLGKLEQSALSLIKELTEENANLHASFTELTRKLEIANLDIECKERICESYMLQYGTVADKEVWLNKERADTVRKYREFLYKGLASLGVKDKFNKEFFLTKADQIAKEMLEGEK